MKKRFIVAFLVLLLPVVVTAYVSPGNPTGYVNDFAGMLKAETVSSLNQTLSQFEQETGAEISVVIIPSRGSEETIETYAVRLFEEWGIGKEKEDNGLLLLVARDDREMRIEVGYGLEPIVTDLYSGRIIGDVLTPAFREQRYDDGIQEAVRLIMEAVRQGSFENTSVGSTSSSVNIANFLPYVVVFLIFLTSLLARSRSWWLGGIIGAIIGWLVFAGIIAVIILSVIGFIFDYIVSKTYKKSKDQGIDPPWWIGGGHHGGGGFGGGFGGFGGGMSGGGGASGRW